ncbi:MFS transporter [Rufibacter roseus]|uniref:MFS transporter n=1 Tax=Rufibacter roseus TaxID=1567108 RepID=A0ABW2DNH5_9BACT|nr:MFS transporter [Rufibacter roseus]
MKASNGKATAIHLFSLKTMQMRTFHLSWIAFFLCFFGWFGIAPLMAIVREELGLTKNEIGNIIISSVAITIVARLLIGWLCDKIGPRISYTIILLLGSLPVMFIGFSNDYESFLLFRLAIGVIGASFVITQYHTTAMFAPNVVGTANATTAGWGNLGGGVTQMVMPLIFAGFVSLGFVDAHAWRYAMVVPGVLMILCGTAYYFLTTDYPAGNKADLQLAETGQKKKQVSFWKTISDYRVWALFVLYGACFGIELTINNIAAIYYHDNFSLSVETAGLIAGLFGLMNIFARTLGGYFGDKAGMKYGLSGRVWFLGAVILVEGVALMLFSHMTVLSLSIIMLVVFSLFVQMAEGATFSVVPFINKKAMGTVAGVVGAGGNAGAVAAGFLFKVESISYPEALFIIGLVVAGTSTLALLVRFSKETEKEARHEMHQLMAERSGEELPSLA